MGTNDHDVQVVTNYVYSKIKDTMVDVYLQRVAQAEISKGNVSRDVKNDLLSILKKSDSHRKLKNAVFRYTHDKKLHLSQTAMLENVKEPISYIRKAQSNWEKRILKSLNSMCTELNVPLAKRRPDKIGRDLLSRWNELGTDEPDLAQFRPVYAPKDFLEVIASLRNVNSFDRVDGVDSITATTKWGIIQVPLCVKELPELRLQFNEMCMNQGQCGADDDRSLPVDSFAIDRARVGKKVLSSSHGPLSKEFAKRGVPLGGRGEHWCNILGLDIDDVDSMYYEQLKMNVIKHELLVDNLIYKDVKLTAANDDQYFVFEDYLYQVLLPFSRDTAVQEHFKYSSASPAKSFIRGKMGLEDYAVIYPPNGVIPFHGFSMYVTPLCYIYNDPVRLYFVFREMYTRYFFRLHTLSSHPEGIIGISLLFEQLLQSTEPLLFYHLKSAGIQP